MCHSRVHLKVTQPYTGFACVLFQMSVNAMHSNEKVQKNYYFENSNLKSRSR